jgi:hypothetical protein
LKLEEEEPEEEVVEEPVEEEQTGARSRKAGQVHAYSCLPTPTCLTRPGKPAVMEPVAFPLGEHLVLEADGNLVCQKCGRSSPLTEADKFAETDCKTTQETAHPAENANTASTKQ